MSVKNSSNARCYQSHSMNCCLWRLYVWELDIYWLSITVVDIVNITHMFSYIALSVRIQSNPRQSLAIKSDENKRANACIEILRQWNIKKATQYWPQTVDIGIWSLGDHSEQCSFIKFVNSACFGFYPYGSMYSPISSTYMANQCSPGCLPSCVLQTKADGYVETASGRVSLATTS